MGWFAASGMFGMFAEYFLKSAIILTLALSAAAILRRRPAAFRHFVLSFSLIGLILLPLLTLAPVGWRTSLLPTRPAENLPQASEIPVSSGQLVDARKMTPPASPDVQAGFPTAGREPGSPGAYSLASAIDGSLRIPDVIKNGRSLGVLNAALAAIWFAGLVILVLRMVFGLAGAIRLTAEGADIGDPAWQTLIGRFLSFVSLRWKIRLKSHPEILLPLTWGWRKPVILLPEGAEVWTEEERSSALFHELSHVKRADFLVILLVRTSLALFWFNPLCWIVYRRLRKEQEIACDEMVLRAGIKPSTYAASLLAFRRSAGFQWNSSAALLGMLGKSSFHERLAAILKQKLTFKEVKMKTRIMLAAAVVLAVALIGTARPAVGIEKKAAAASAVETVTPASGPAASHAASVQPVDQEQEKQAAKAQSQEKEKEKTAGEEKIVVMSKEGKKTPLEIIITEGDQVKMLVLEKPLIITSGKDGRGLVLTSEGKELRILKEEPLRLEIKGGLELIKEGKSFSVSEGGGLKIVREGGQGDSKIMIYKSLEPSAGVGKEIKIKADGATFISEADGPYVYAFTKKDKELLDRIREIRGQLQKVRENKLDLAEVEKSLEKIETELKAGEEKSGQLRMGYEIQPGRILIRKKIVDGESQGTYIINEGKAENRGIIKAMVSEKEDTIRLFITGKKGKEGRDAYDRAVEKIKTALSEGYELDSKFDEESGTMTFQITSPKGKKDNKDLINKLLESLKEDGKK